MKAKYAAFLPDLATRGDLNRVIQWMCSELAVGHHRVGGGDRLDAGQDRPRRPARRRLRGRERPLPLQEGLRRPELERPSCASPLTEPGVDVKAGEYLLAVERQGRCARPTNLYARFENTAGKIVEITVGPTPDGKGARTVQGRSRSPTRAALRNRDWVEGNLRKVDEATGGRVAYVYVPNTADARPHLLQALLLPPGRQGRRSSSTSASTAAARWPTTTSTSCAGRSSPLGHALRRRPEDADAPRSRGRR